MWTQTWPHPRFQCQRQAPAAQPPAASPPRPQRPSSAAPQPPAVLWSHGPSLLRPASVPPTPRVPDPGGQAPSLPGPRWRQQAPNPRWPPGTSDRPMHPALSRSRSLTLLCLVLAVLNPSRQTNTSSCRPPGRSSGAPGTVAPS
jgi:hypothetical protein